MATDFDFLPDSIEPLNSVSVPAQASGFSRGRKIDLAQMLQMRAAGKTQKECAEHFGCSISAISQQEAKATPPRPEILDRLSPAQERFVFAMAEGKSQTQAALDSFEVSTRGSASVIGARHMKDPLVQEALNVVLETEGLTRRKLVRRLVQLVDSPDGTVAHKAVDTGLKLTESYPVEKRMNLNLTLDLVSPVDLSRYRNV